MSECFDSANLKLRSWEENILGIVILCFVTCTGLNLLCNKTWHPFCVWELELEGKKQNKTLRELCFCSPSGSSCASIRRCGSKNLQHFCYYVSIRSRYTDLGKRKRIACRLRDGVSMARSLWVWDLLNFNVIHTARREHKSFLLKLLLHLVIHLFVYAMKVRGEHAGVGSSYQVDPGDWAQVAREQQSNLNCLATMLSWHFLKNYWILAEAWLWYSSFAACILISEGFPGTIGL